LLQGASAALCLARSRPAAFIRHPYLQNVQTDRASVLWTAAEAASGTVTATGPDGVKVTAEASVRAFSPMETGLSAPFCQYRAELTGLQPGTHYSYQVAMNGDVWASDPKLFHLRTAGTGAFSFLVFGDSGADSTEQATLVRMMAAEPRIAMALHVGDLAYPNGTFANFNTGHYEPTAPLMRRVCLFPTPGNHEYNTDSAAAYLAGISVPANGVPANDEGRYYSFDWSNVHFAAVDSNLLLSSRAGAMLEWLDADLAATQQQWRIVFLHHPPYPTGFHMGDPLCVAAKTLVVPIVERYGVQLVLSGHEHGYERSYPLAGGVPADPPSPSTLYVISGGGGGALESVGSLPQCALSVEAFNYLRVDVESDSLRLRAIGLKGETVDTVTIGTATSPAIHKVMSVGDYTPAVASGSLICITGQNLAPRTVASPGSLPKSSLDGIAVTAGGVAAPLLSVSPGEINAQLPLGLAGRADLQVLTHGGAVSASVNVLAAAPSILAVRSKNRPLHYCNPIRPGAAVKLYLSGVSATDALEVWLGETRLEPTFSGQEPGRAGVYRVEVEVPPELPDGLYALEVAAGDASSRPANVDISATAVTAANDRAIMRARRRTSE
jgi:uncharacterized protein (TIGR03437 family)